MEIIPVIVSQNSPTFNDLHLHGTPVLTDWSGTEMQKLVKFLFWVDGSRFHFLASESGTPGMSHPESRQGFYQPELWKYDVAEFFLKSTNGARYLEFNLAPNGAWWSSAFNAPRTASPGEPKPIPAVLTSAHQTENGWQVMASLPLDWLKENYGFGDKTTLNATFILNSPDQVFLTAGDLGSGEPDFHRPDHFASIEQVSLA